MMSREINLLSSRFLFIEHQTINNNFEIKILNQPSMTRSLDDEIEFNSAVSNERRGMKKKKKNKNKKNRNLNAFEIYFSSADSAQ